MNRGTPPVPLEALAGELRAESSVIAPHVVDTVEVPAPLGALAAAGPRAASAPDEYALIVEAVREGYLLHYENPRLLAGADADLALLAGDHLYALGLDRLAALGDLAAVGELADLISISAQLHAEGRESGLVGALWLASVASIACGAPPTHEEAKAALQAGRAGSARALLEPVREAAVEAGAGEALEAAAQAIDFADPSG